MNLYLKDIKNYRDLINGVYNELKQLKIAQTEKEKELDRSTTELLDFETKRNALYEQKRQYNTLLNKIKKIKTSIWKQGILSTIISLFLALLIGGYFTLPFYVISLIAVLLTSLGFITEASKINLLSKYQKKLKHIDLEQIENEIDNVKFNLASEKRSNHQLKNETKDIQNNIKEKSEKLTKLQKTVDIINYHYSAAYRVCNSFDPEQNDQSLDKHYRTNTNQMLEEINNLDSKKIKIPNV